MSVYLESKADVIGLFLKKTGLSIPEADLIVSLPKVNDNPDRPEDSQIRVTVGPANASYSGSEVFYYDRLNLARLVNYPAPDYPPMAGIGLSVYSLLSQIKGSMGLQFTRDDLVETFTVSTGGAGGSVLLKAKPTSVGWSGEFNLPLGVKPLLSSIFANDTIIWS